METCAIQHIGDPDAFWRCAVNNCGANPGTLIQMVIYARVGERYLREVRATTDA
jgi:hypothetical protein